MHYLISTHSRLLSLKLDENWQITDMTIIGDGHHYGIALLPGNPLRKPRSKDPNRDSPRASGRW
jgi:hypothetical protein